MNETMARSLRPAEIAEELRYHADPGVARLALAVINKDVDGCGVAEELEDAKSQLRELEDRCERLESALEQCDEALGDDDSSMAKAVREIIEDAR